MNTNITSPINSDNGLVSEDFTLVLDELRKKKNIKMLQKYFKELSHWKPYNRDKIIEAFKKFEIAIDVSLMCEDFESGYKWESKPTVDDFELYLRASQKSYPRWSKSFIDWTSDIIQWAVQSIWELPWGQYWKNTAKWLGYAGAAAGAVWWGMVAWDYLSELNAPAKIEAQASAEVIARMRAMSDNLSNPLFIMKLSKEWILSFQDAWRVQKAMEQCREPLEDQSLTELPASCEKAILVLKEALDNRTHQIMEELAEKSQWSPQKTMLTLQEIWWYKYMADESMKKYQDSPNDAVARLDSILSLTKLFKAIGHGQHYLTEYNSEMEKIEWLKKIDDTLRPIIASLDTRKKNIQWV